MEHEATSQATCVAQIAGYFEKFGWQYEQADDVTFRAGVSGRHDVFTVLVRVTTHWVIFTINPLMRPDPGGFGPATLRALATANHRINMAKIGIDPDGDAFINAELPIENFCYSQFADAISAVAHYADQLILPLLQARRVDAINAQMPD